MKRQHTTLARSPTVTRTPLIMPLFALTPVPSQSFATRAWNKWNYKRKRDERWHSTYKYKCWTLCMGAMYGRTNRSQLRIKQPNNFALSSLHLLSALLTG